MKTSLRERYKQADLEGSALRQVYPKAKSYLITLSEKEVPQMKQKIKEGSIAGIEDCILASKPQFSKFLCNIKNHTFYVAQKILPIQGYILRQSTISFLFLPDLY